MLLNYGGSPYDRLRKMLFLVKVRLAIQDHRDLNSPIYGKMYKVQ